MIDVQELLAQARETTGLLDMGDEAYREPLQRLATALNTEAKLNDIGRYRAKDMLLNALIWRLKLIDWVKQHPEVRDQTITRPIFVAGLPRTGTTALMHMLNQDTDNHTLRLWEGREPLPPPEEASYNSDPRIAKRLEELAVTEQFMPGFSKTHLLDAQEPDECYMLLNRCFMSVEFSALFHIPSYANWLYQTDLTDTYRHHEMELQILQSRKSGHWVLKSPFHQVGLKAIDKVYPDALFVMTHRAPVTIVGSGCSFSEVLRKPYVDELDLEQVGRDWLDMLRAYAERSMRERDALEAVNPGRFVDIDYDAYMTNPLVEIERIYAAAGRELGDTARAAMQHWLDAHPPGKHGKHEYDLARYGLSTEQVQTVFADYAERFKLSLT